MADVTMKTDLVRIDVLENIDRVARRHRNGAKNARRAATAAVENVLVWTTAKLVAAAKAKPKNRRTLKRFVFVLAFLAIAFAFLQTDILNALLSIPFAIFG